VLQIFKQLSRIPTDVIIGQRNAIVTAATCRLISITLTLTEINLGLKSSVPNWRDIVDHGLKHGNPIVQEAAADAMSSFSKFVDCAPIVAR
jgi:tubulin-specific chaperone D